MTSLVQLVLLLCVCYIQNTRVSSEKRILLSDPSFVQSTLHDMEVKIQDLIQKQAQQDSDLTQQKAISAQLETEVTQQKAKAAQNEATVRDISLQLATKAGGDLYTRWGRKSCQGNNTELVYSGFAGGSYYNDPGAAAEYVCLPPDPIYHTYFELLHDGKMYDAEYEGGNLFNQDVPCAVCRSTVHSTVLMIPARNECYSGWEVQYRGMLSSGYYGAITASQYVCLDEAIEAVSHGAADDNGKLFYSVLGVCGSLPCLPYKNGELLTCVVCAK